LNITHVTPDVMTETIIPLILCGGAGTRLWPASREGRPKQFLRLFGPHSTFQETLLRVSDPALFGRPIVITNGNYRFLVAEQLAEIGLAADILLEPARRDSGPALAAGAGFGLARGGDPQIVALAADHVITDAAAFAVSCGAARDAAAEHIVTFGVRPDRAATEYGYICPGEPLGPAAFRVKKLWKSPMPRPRRVTSPMVICGIRGISCSGPRCSWRNTAVSSRRAPMRLRSRWHPPAAISAL
jgi:mannose-1-phosphate guanylyltransferase/mannose-1-phosphate guanylyltransferase/mannose-6-phosphate isomerase